jgi:RHS repeat-associated protein
VPDSDSGQSPSPTVEAPTIELPKGGGAIRGIGEKFGANPVNGTGTMSVPIITSPGRSGFGPQLSLQYDSGEGNGPFGFGWGLSLPTITRKTAKGLPRYDDAHESDVFILSGSEDLVPANRLGRDGTPVCGRDGEPVVHEDRVDGYLIRRYRPRIEGLFARIERWMSLDRPGDVHWRSYSKDNVLTVYGLDAESRIADPLQPSRIFSWLVTEVRDDRGNAVLYHYAAEDGVGVDLNRPSERNRGGRDDPRRTANRYLTHIRYGNRVPLLDADGRRPLFLDRASVGRGRNDDLWLFETVFDYGGHTPDAPLPHDAAEWAVRHDPFSTYRAGFEVRTTRLCRRVLMFHHFPGEPGVGRNCLVRSTDFGYSAEDRGSRPADPVGSFLYSVTQAGYRRRGRGYLRATLPPVEFDYSVADVNDKLEVVDPGTLANLPAGVDGTTNQWVDLYGEGIPGILTDQGNAWFYRRNLTPAGDGCVEFGPLETVGLRPNSQLADRTSRLMDLAADGHPDLVVLGGPMPGFYEQAGENGWAQFRPFTATLNRPLPDSAVRFIDLDGDGRADVMLTEDDAIVWHPSLGEDGFGPARRVARSGDEEKGPRLVFAGDSDSVYLADLSGDGLTDLVRIRNGDISYWPNLGYGRFGARVAMDESPRMDEADRFDQRRVRLADIDGSGTTDLIYLHPEGVRLYFNRSGNGWSRPRILSSFPSADSVSTIDVTDLLGNGTACLVWSSPLPGEAGRPMRYVNLMGDHKPHLLVRSANNLGAETRIHYVSSTKFFLDDRAAGRPWHTRLPFPVHVVDFVETFDRVSRNRFVTRYMYHDGYFDGVEREFRGFGMVEQWDAEEIGALGTELTPLAVNLEAAHHLPPTRTKTWFHTGASPADRRQPRGNGRFEYFRNPLFGDDPAVMLAPESHPPPWLSFDEQREAYRALKGFTLHREVYAEDAGPDATPAERRRAGIPYLVTDQDFALRCEQRRGGNRHAVFFAHPRESLSYQFERNPADPRVQHSITLRVDRFGNTLESVAIGYGRLTEDVSLGDADRRTQSRSLITGSESHFTNPVDGDRNYSADYRCPQPVESSTYEITGISPASGSRRFLFSDWVSDTESVLTDADEITDAQEAEPNTPRKRLIERARTRYRSDDLGKLLPLGVLEPRALEGEAYRLAFTSAMLQHVFQRDRVPLITDEQDVVGGDGGDQGGYRDLDGDGLWWIPGGRSFLSPDSDDDAQTELAVARRQFFLPQRTRDPFGAETVVEYDAYLLLPVDTRDALGNRITVGERLADGHRDPSVLGNDYRVLKPARLMDPNRNRRAVGFDAMGLVVSSAILGSPEDTTGDSLDGVDDDLDPATVGQHLEHPLDDPWAVLGTSTTRLLYDYFAFQRTKHLGAPSPAVAYTLARATHEADLRKQSRTEVVHSFEYSDGYERIIQRKHEAASAADDRHGTARWVTSEWVVYNNRGKPVRQFEPGFSSTHRFEFGVHTGVSPTLFYDPSGRIVATLHPDGSYEKVTFDPWAQATWDVNDTVLGDPRTDPDISGYTAAFLETEPGRRTWYQQRQSGELGPAQTAAAAQAARHADTPAVAHLDCLGRAFVTFADNGPQPGFPAHQLVATRIHLDIEGNKLAILDAPDHDGPDRSRIVMRYDYDMLGTKIRQASADAGERWVLNNVAGNPIRTWDDRAHRSRTEYDKLRRPLRIYVTGCLAAEPERECLTDRLLYGEQAPDAEHHNLRRQLHVHLDQSGLSRNADFDIAGNPRRVERRLAVEYRDGIDWAPVDSPLSEGPAIAADLEAAAEFRLDGTTYATITVRDALDRPIRMTSPHAPNSEPTVLRPRYDEAGQLRRLDGRIPAPPQGGRTRWVPFVTQVQYDAKGRRTLITYGSRRKRSVGVTTTYGYDPLTFRLIHLATRRSPHGRALQDLHYVYDPAGNITHVNDDAQQPVFFRNSRIDASLAYTYDPLYRVVSATGREHLGQGAQAPSPWGADDRDRVGLETPGDATAFARYVENYAYDPPGNVTTISHHGSDATRAGWVRHYRYEERSSIRPEERSNRLSATTTSGDGTGWQAYAYDAHGNMTRMPDLPTMVWDHRDQLRATARQVVAEGTPETTWYVYDSGGTRVRKVTDGYAGAGAEPHRIAERIYLDGFEVFRTYDHAGTRVRLERETVHVMDDQRRVAVVETRITDVDGTDLAPERLIRYQLADHLGSSQLEVDDRARVISYEEYAPYGSTTYQAVRRGTDAPKRYRYTGHERDEESGLSYHHMRYYADWLGRWTAADPAGAKDGVNLFAYARGNPVNNTDSTGTSCDPTLATCIDATTPTPREEALQSSLPPEERNLPAASSASEAAPPPPAAAAPPAAGRVIYPPPPVSPTDYTLYVPQGFAYTQREAAIREVDDSNNPWYLRGGMFVLALAATPLALAEEYLARPITNVPFAMHNAGIGIGEHAGRAILWHEQGENLEATVEGLETIKSFSTGFVSGASVALPIAGALESRAIGTTTAIASGTSTAPAAAASETLTFYTVQNEANAARLLAGGGTWPTGVSKSVLGEGLYTWGTRAEAEAYQLTLQTRYGATGLQIMEARIPATQYQGLKLLDLRPLGDDAVNAWMNEYSLYGNGAPHGLDHVIRQTGMGAEYFFSKYVFPLLKF